MSSKPISLLDGAILRQAALAAFAKMNPLKLWRNPVMFATELAAIYVLVLFMRDLAAGASGAAFAGQIAFWLALTVWFATFAEGIAEGRGKAQAASLRRARSELMARRIVDGKPQSPTAASDLKVPHPTRSATITSEFASRSPTICATRTSIATIII